MDYMEYINSDVLVLVPVLWMIGNVLQHTPRLPVWTIPYLIGILGITLSMLRICSSQDMNAITIFSSFTQGILVAGGSIMSDRIMKEMIKRRDTTK